MTKKNIIAIILSVVLAVSAGVGIYFLTRDKASEQTVAPSTTAVQDWIEDYDFSDDSENANTYENHTLPPYTVH